MRSPPSPPSDTTRTILFWSDPVDWPKLEGRLASVPMEGLLPPCRTYPFQSPTRFSYPSSQTLPFWRISSSRLFSSLRDTKVRSLLPLSPHEEFSFYGSAESPSFPPSILSPPSGRIRQEGFCGRIPARRILVRSMWYVRPLPTFSGSARFRVS